MNLLLLLSLTTLDHRPAFLETSPFARPAALGGAFAAIREDAAAVFWNPAAPGRSGLQFSLADWLLDSRLATGAGAYELQGIGTLQAGLSYLAFGDMPRWDEQGDLLGFFSAYDFQAKLGFRRSLGGFLDVGVGIGLIGEKVDDWSSNRAAVDAGLIGHWSFLTAGLVVRDLMFGRAPFLKALALSARPFDALLVSAQVEHAERLRFRAGTELRLPPIALRAGFDGQSPCFGLGFRGRGVTIDYASVLHRDLGLVHQITLGISR